MNARRVMDKMKHFFYSFDFIEESGIHQRVELAPRLRQFLTNQEGGCVSLGGAGPFVTKGPRCRLPYLEKKSGSR